METEPITLYRCSVKQEELAPLLARVLRAFPRGYAILESFQENLFEPVASLAAEEKRPEDLLGGRIFDGARQFHFRRITSELFWAAWDFPWEVLPQDSMEMTCRTSTRRIFLWGYKNAELGGAVYEERVPRLFHYPGGEDLEAGEHMALEVLEFLDGAGRPVWTRFLGPRTRKGPVAVPAVVLAGGFGIFTKLLEMVRGLFCQSL